jgi:hypothetical protein
VGDDEPEGAETPTEGDEGAEKEGEEQVALGTEEELPPALPEPVAPELVPAKVMYQGVEHEVMVTPDAAKAIEAQHMTAQQLPHLQGKYDELRRQTEGVSTLPGTTADEAGQPKFSQENFQKAMQPRIDEAVKTGTMTETFVNEFPAESAYGVWLFDAVQQMAGTLHTVSSSIARDAQTAEMESFTQGVYGQMGEMATANPQVFGELAEQPKREAFFKFVVEANPTIGQLMGDQTRETLEGLHAWYKKNEMAAGIQAAQAHAKAEHEENRLLAGGAGGGGGSRSKPKSKHPDIDEVFKD